MGVVALPPPTQGEGGGGERWGGSFFLNCSFEYQFNSSLRAFSQTIAKSVSLNVRSENTVRSSNHKLNYKIENLHADAAYCCIIATTTKLDHVSLSLESKKTF